MEDDHYRGFG
jgi:hypothetical protein